MNFFFTAKGIIKKLYRFFIDPSTGTSASSATAQGRTWCSSGDRASEGPLPPAPLGDMAGEHADGIAYHAA